MNFLLKEKTDEFEYQHYWEKKKTSVPVLSLLLVTQEECDGSYQMRKANIRSTLLYGAQAEFFYLRKPSEIFGESFQVIDWKIFPRFKEKVEFF